MSNLQAPTPSSIEHIDEIFSGSSLEAFLDAKFAQLLAQADNPLPAPAAAAEPLANCLLDSETELLDFLRQRLSYLERRVGE